MDTIAPAARCSAGARFLSSKQRNDVAVLNYLSRYFLTPSAGSCTSVPGPGK
jgi:hypothetical protein